MAKNNKADMSCARVKKYTASDVSKAERHNERKNEMPAKNCTVCGVEYVPGSGASRYCPACAKKIRREKSNESKRRSREQKRIACMNCPQKMTD